MYIFLFFRFPNCTALCPAFDQKYGVFGVRAACGILRGNALARLV